MNKIEVYKFVKVKQLVYQLIKLYRTNDMNSHKTQKDFLLNEINDIFKEKILISRTLLHRLTM